MSVLVTPYCLLEFIFSTFLDNIFCPFYSFQVAALILENTFTSILDMAGVLLPFLKWFIGSTGSKGPKVLNFLVRSPWSTIDVIGHVSLNVGESSCFQLIVFECIALVRLSDETSCQAFVVTTQHTPSFLPLFENIYCG